MRVLDLDLDVYQGPFDLLFTLVLREEVDIFEVPMVEVILAYVEALLQEEQADWEGLTEFLVLISSLLELKSRVLLPGAEPAAEDMDAETARDVLLARLLAYRRFKMAAEALAAVRDRQRACLVRSPARQPRRLLTPVDEVAATQDPDALRAAMERVIEARRPPDTTHVAAVRVGLNRQIAAIRRILRERGRLSFDEEFGSEEPMVQAVSLLALLGLVARGDVYVQQDGHFADILVEQAARQARVRRIA